MIFAEILDIIAYEWYTSSKSPTEAMLKRVARQVVGREVKMCRDPLNLSHYISRKLGSR